MVLPFRVSDCRVSDCQRLSRQNRIWDAFQPMYAAWCRRWSFEAQARVSRPEGGREQRGAPRTRQVPERQGTRRGAGAGRGAGAVRRKHLLEELLHGREEGVVVGLAAQPRMEAEGVGPESAPGLPRLGAAREDPVVLHPVGRHLLAVPVSPDSSTGRRFDRAARFALSRAALSNRDRSRSAGRSARGRIETPFLGRWTAVTRNEEQRTKRVAPRRNRRRGRGRRCCKGAP